MNLDKKRLFLPFLSLNLSSSGKLNMKEKDG